MEAALGLGAGFRLQTNPTRLEIQDISGDDEEDAMRREEVPLDQFTVKWIRPTRGGNQYALVEVNEHAAKRILKKARFRIGLVFCWNRLTLERMAR